MLLLISVQLKMTEVKLLDKNAKFWGAKQCVLYLWMFLPVVLDCSVVKSVTPSSRGKNACNHNAEVYRASF